MRRILAVIPVALLLTAGAMHLSLTASSPGKDEVVTAAPSTVSLTYSAPVNVKVSTVSILANDSTEVAKLEVKAGPRPTMLEAKVPHRLPAGRYIVRWKTAGSDGHAMRGAFGFTVNPVE